MSSSIDVQQLDPSRLQDLAGDLLTYLLHGEELFSLIASPAPRPSLNLPPLAKVPETLLLMLSTTPSFIHLGISGISGIMFLPIFRIIPTLFRVYVGRTVAL